MAMRMIPIGPTFQKMARLVRDVSRKAGKQVNLTISGEDTELDKTVIQQIDGLIESVVDTCEGPQETEIVMALIRLRDDLTGRADLGNGWGKLISDSRDKVEELVNEFFKAKLLGIPEVQEFLESLEEKA